MQKTTKIFVIFEKVLENLMWLTTSRLFSKL